MLRALSLAIPLTVAMLAVNLAFGVLARAAPALNPIQLGLPVSLLLGLFLLALLAGEMGPPVQRVRRRLPGCGRGHTDPVITNCRLKSPGLRVRVNARQRGCRTRRPSASACLACPP